MTKAERLDRVEALISSARRNPERFPSPFGYLQYEGDRTPMFDRLRRLYPIDEVEDYSVHKYAVRDLRELFERGRVKLVARGGYTWVVTADVYAPLEELVSAPVNRCNSYDWQNAERLPELADDDELDGVEWARRRENGILAEIVAVRR